MKKKGDVEFDELIPWLIGLVLFALMVIGYFYLKNKDINLIEYIKNLFRFRGG